MKNIITLSILGCLTLTTQAQEDDDNNLIDNPSFEIIDGKISKLSKLKKIEMAKDWTSPTAMKADLFSKKAKEVATAPDNVYGREFPMDGDNYAGIVAYSYNNKEPRTYIQTEFIGPLKKDVEYCIKYYVSLSDLSKYGVNNLGMYVSKTPIEIESKEDIIFEKAKEIAHVVVPSDNSVKMARYNWEPVCGIYKASGKEKYLIIGNFKNNKDTKYEKLKKKPDIKGTQMPKAYYYVDNIEVFVLENPEDCDCSNKKEESIGESVIYHKQFTSEDGFTLEQQVKFSTIYFDNLNTDIDPIMETDLENLVKLLKENPEIKIEVNAHADKDEVVAAAKQPDNEKWQKIDEKRAEVIKEYLVKNGIDESRLIVKSHSSLRSASDGTSALDKAKNRRVEFKIVE